MSDFKLAFEPLLTPPMITLHRSLWRSFASAFSRGSGSEDDNDLSAEEVTEAERKVVSSFSTNGKGVAASSPSPTSLSDASGVGAMEAAQRRVEALKMRKAEIEGRLDENQAKAAQLVCVGC